MVISWVPFWLNREATSDRITLGITTVLTMTFLGLEARKNLPEVPYATALDVFLFISYMYIILTVIQFGAVHHFTKLGSGEFYPEELEDEISFSKVKIFYKNITKYFCKSHSPSAATNKWRRSLPTSDREEPRTRSASC